MPAPVTFNLSLAPLPVNANSYTPQQWAQAVVDRLTIAPSAPWSSFQNGGSIPTSDVGPVLYNGMQWKVWSAGAGEYVDLVVEGGGLVSRTVMLNAMADQAPGGLLYYDASGHAAVLTPATVPTGPNWVSGSSYVVGNYVTYLGVVYRCILATSGAVAPSADTTHWTANSGTTTGDVLTQSSAGLPVWQTLPGPVTASYFETILSGNLSITTDGNSVVLPFNTVKNQANVVFNTTLYRIPVTSGSVWFFWANIELSRTTTSPSTDVQISVEVRPNGNPNVGVGGFVGYSAVQGQTGVCCSGVLPFAADGYADCAIAVLELVPHANGITVFSNTSLTRFGGFRIT